MFAVEVRDHIMIAHSLTGEVFGPAQNMHGATYTVDVAFFRSALNSDGIVVDIGRAHEAVAAVLAPFRFANLDEVFPGENTTTEWIAARILAGMTEAARTGALGPGSNGLETIRVTLGESHVARAWVEGPVGA
ncbi:MAG: 6-carboxytetrahydropterin synthase [Pseudomonadota bacterium]